MKKLILILLLIPYFGNAQTPTFACGFECGQFNTSGGANLGEHVVTVLSGGVSFSTTTKRSGLRSLRLNYTGTGGGGNVPSFTASAVTVSRNYIYFGSLPTADTWLIYHSNQTPGAYFKNSDSKIYAGHDNGGITLGSTGISVTTGVWYRIDIKVDKSANPWTIDVKVDGADCSQLTLALAATTTGTIGFGLANVTGEIFIDDFIMSRTGADYPLGAGYVNQFLPGDPDGTHSGLTANDFERTLTGTDIINTTTDSYLLLDDEPLESGASVDWVNMIAPVVSTYTEYIFKPGTGISTPTTAPRMVSVIIGIHAAGTGAYNAEWLLNDNGTTASIYSPSAVAGITTIVYKQLNLADPPSAATSWTLSGNGNFNDLRIRFGPGGTVDANPDVYFDCAMIEAEFAEVILTTPGTPSDKRHTTLGVGSYANRSNLLDKKLLSSEPHNKIISYSPSIYKRFY